jgi:hypothetical protein
MVSQNIRRSRSSVFFQSTSTPGTSSHQGEVLVIDTTYHTVEDQCLGYDEIYRIFNTWDFPLEDNDLEVYQNIKKRGTHLVDAWSTLFPYNETTQWCFKWFDLNTATIISKHGRQITSSRPEDINARYYLPTLACALNEPFLMGFA